MPSFYSIDTLGDVGDGDDLEGIFDDVRDFAKRNDDLVSLVTSGPVGYAVNLAVKNNRQTPQQKAADRGLFDEFGGVVSSVGQTIQSTGKALSAGSGRTSGATPAAYTPPKVATPTAPKPSPVVAALPYAGGAALAGAAFAYYRGAKRAALGLGVLGAAGILAPLYIGIASKGTAAK